MVFPLFVMALLWDRFRLGERRFLQARPVRLRLGGWVLVTNTINLLVAAGFTVMGIFVIYLAGTGTMTSGPAFQGAAGRGLAGLFERFEQWVSPVPEPLLGVGVMALAAVFVVATLRDRGHPQHRRDADVTATATEGGGPADTCHHAAALHTSTAPDDAQHH